MRLGFVETQVTDLGEAARFYEKLVGLQKTAEKGDTLYFKCWDEYDHHSLVLRKSASPGLDRIGWKVEQDSDLDKAEKSIQSYGVKVSRISRQEDPWLGEALSFVSPSGPCMLL
jgi:catechol 2,3-dioxygenase